MKVLRINDDPKTITIIPRVMPQLEDILVVKLRDEITDITSIIDHTFDYSNNYFNLVLGDADVENFYQVFKKYELVISREGTIIYRGKLIFIHEDDSIQDFQHAIITNKKIKF